MHSSILEQQEKLERLFDLAKLLHDDQSVDDQIKSAFVSYLCVRTSGYIETSVITILREYSETKTRAEIPTIANFVQSHLQFTFNPWPSQVLELVGRFNVNWKNHIRDEIRHEISESVYAIVKNRNRIAHGEDVDLRLDDIRRSFRDAEQLVNLIYGHCNPEQASAAAD